MGKKKTENNSLPSVKEIKPFLHWIFHVADRIYVEHTIGWRENAIEEMYIAYKRKKILIEKQQKMSEEQWILKMKKEGFELYKTKDLKPKLNLLYKVQELIKKCDGKM